MPTVSQVVKLNKELDQLTIDEQKLAVNGIELGKRRKILATYRAQHTSVFVPNFQNFVTHRQPLIAQYQQLVDHIETCLQAPVKTYIDVITQLYKHLNNPANQPFKASTETSALVERMDIQLENIILELETLVSLMPTPQNTKAEDLFNAASSLLKEFTCAYQYTSRFLEEKKEINSMQTLMHHDDKMFSEAEKKLLQDQQAMDAALKNLTAPSKQPFAAALFPLFQTRLERDMRRVLTKLTKELNVKSPFESINKCSQ